MQTSLSVEACRLEVNAATCTVAHSLVHPSTLPIHKFVVFVLRQDTLPVFVQSFVAQVQITSKYVFYVGVTRTKENLYIVDAEDMSRSYEL